MKRIAFVQSRTISTCLFLSIFFMLAHIWMPTQAQAAVFAPQQIESLVQLLKAFGADAAVVERVTQTLGGQTPTSRPATPSVPYSASRAATPTSFSSPSWMKDLIIYEMRMETFAEGATDGNYFKVATVRLPELADLGVTAVSINPIAQGNGPVPNVRYRVLYGPSQPDKLDPQLGTDADFALFVATAHSLGIKVIVDNVIHGISPSSPYVSGPQALPAHFFVRAADGSVVKTWWGTAQLNWSSAPLREWWVENIGVAWVQKYDIDGFRLDLVPDLSPIVLWEEFKAGIVQKTGKRVILIPEMSPTTRAAVFDIGQADTGSASFHKLDFYGGAANVVDTIKRSPYRFYSNQISSHDSTEYNAKGRLGAFAYGSVLSPYVPSWFMGEEFNAQVDKSDGANTPAYVANGPLYMSRLHWQEKAQNKTFYEQVKKLIQIRKEYADIVAPSEDALKDTRITKVTHYSGVDLEPYSMWKGSVSITVVAKRDAASGSATFSIPVDVMGMRHASFKVTELLSETSSVYSRTEVLQGISMNIPRGGVAVVKAEGIGEESAIEEPAVERNDSRDARNVENRLTSGYFERASCTTVEGWVVDPDSPNSIASVRIYKDGPATSGVLIGTYPTDILRDDVTARNTTIPGLVAGRHGFSIPLGDGIKDGATHRLYVYGVDNETGALRELEQGPRTVTCASETAVPPTPTPVPAASDRAPHGYVDIADCSRLAGWAYDPDDPAASIMIHIYDGSVAIGGYKADQPRSDVNRVVGIAGDHGFVAQTPQSLKDGKPHTLHFYGINTNTGGHNKELVYSPKTITCGTVSGALPARSLLATVVHASFGLLVTLLTEALYTLGL